jgi:hypothetical protein
MKNILLVLTSLAVLSCNRVNFSSKTSSDDPPAPPQTTTTVNVGPLGTINCQVYLNSQLQSVTIILPGTNPTVTANCNPSDITYTWSVTKNGSAVTVNGLQGSQSNPDFTSLGAGTYSITLRGTANNYAPYNSGALTVIINSGTTPPVSTVSCNPRMNGSLTSITLPENPRTVMMAANCQPPDASCQWTTTLNATPVNVNGLTGCSPTGDFTGLNPGTYNVYLTATKANHTAFTTSQPLTVTIPVKTTRSVTTKKDVTLQDNQLDVVLIVDDSNSMLADNQKLAAKLQSFVTDLSTAGFDWQMCVTVTRAQQLSASDPELYWGASRNWVGNTGASPWILKSGAGNLNSIFTNTINEIGAGWVGTDDERGIKAAWWHLWNGDINYSGNSGCYRKDAGLSVIIISDEDVRSVGGDYSRQFYFGEYKPLEADDQPIHYYNEVRTVFGPLKRFNVNSIIVRPGDNACMASQDAAGSKSHFGYKYDEVSKMTLGATASICDADYGNSLKYFKDNIVREMASLPLECHPVNNQVRVTISPEFTTTTRVEGSTLYFNPKIPAGKSITAEYECSL